MFMAGKRRKYKKAALEWAAKELHVEGLMKMSPSYKEVMNRVVDDLLLYGASGYRESVDGTITHLSQEDMENINDLAPETPQDEPEDPNLTPFQRLLLRAKNKK